MNPRRVLLDAALREIQPDVLRWREAGWPTEVLAVNDGKFFGVRVEIRCDYIPVPVEAAERSQEEPE